MGDKMEVRRIERQEDRTLIYGASKWYHVIADPDCHVKEGDTILHEPYGINFGWFVKVIEKTEDKPK